MEPQEAKVVANFLIGDLENEMKATLRVFGGVPTDGASRAIQRRQRREIAMFVLAIGLYALSSFIILFMEFKRMALMSRISLLIQFAALFMMAVAWLGISF
jgi:hypothetical protein